MIVLDKESVVKPHTVIVSSSLSNGILGEQSPSWYGLSSVEDLDREASNSLHELVRQAGNSAKVLQEIERGPLGA